MKTFAVLHTNFMEQYLETKKDFIKYECFGDSYIIYARDENQIFWFGVGYGCFIADKDKNN